MASKISCIDGRSVGNNGGNVQTTDSQQNEMARAKAFVDRYVVHQKYDGYIIQSLMDTTEVELERFGSYIRTEDVK